MDKSMHKPEEQAAEDYSDQFEHIRSLPANERPEDIPLLIYAAFLEGVKWAREN